MNFGTLRRAYDIYNIYAGAKAVAYELSPLDHDNKRDWAIHILKTVNKIFNRDFRCECKNSKLLVVDYLDYIVYMWMAVAKIADELGVESSIYRKQHKQSRQLRDKGKDSLGPIRWKQEDSNTAWIMYDSAHELLALYAETGSL